MARFQKDIMIGADLDILIVDGNLVWDDATRQHQQVILLLEDGECLHDPLLGVGVANWLLDDADFLDLQHKIQSKFERDGMQIEKIDLTAFPNVKILADYE